MVTKRIPEKKFPSSATLKKVREELSDLAYKGGNLALPEDASEIERAKYKLCQLIAKYQREHELTQSDLAKKIEIAEPRVSEMIRGKIVGFTIERLMVYAQKLYPNVKIDILAS
jgi:predicted XRE-type DNA-binding protein